MRVYVAGPITKGDQFRNVTDGITAGQKLLRHGHAPYVPHLNYSWHMIYPNPTDVWYDLDNAWLVLCDAVVRLPGESPGADAEVKLAKAHDIPVFEGVEAFLAWDLQEQETMVREFNKPTMEMS